MYEWRSCVALFLNQKVDASTFQNVDAAGMPLHVLNATRF